MSEARAAYAAAGVDVAAGDRAVELMRAAVERTRRPEVLGGLGGVRAPGSLPAGLPGAGLAASTRRRRAQTALPPPPWRSGTIGRDPRAPCARGRRCTR